MTRIKKSRGPGQLAAGKSTRETAAQTKERQRKANRKGLAAGSRQNVPELSSPNNEQQAAKDPRHGSKKPVALGNTKPADKQTDKPKDKQKVQQETTQAPRVAKVEAVDNADQLTPEQELEQLENDERLNGLLDQVDAGNKLNKADAAWLDKRLARHQQLLEQLGLLDEDDQDQESDEGDDLWTRFMDAEFDPAQYEDKEDKS